MKKLMVTVAAGAALLVGAASAHAHTFTIRGDWKMGSFFVKRDGTLRGAINAFGIPGSRVKLHGGMACIVRWPRHDLKIDFYNLGGRNACRPAYGPLLRRPRARLALGNKPGARDRRSQEASQEALSGSDASRSRAGLLAGGMVARPAFLPVR
jgi:hypothetical protein